MKFSIIIVNWNAGLFLKRCLDSLHLAKQNFQGELEVFVVDNASTDGSLQDLENHPLQIRLMKLPQNVGFARANNLALTKATGELLFLLNPDTEVVPESLVELARFFEEHPRAGIVGPKLLNPDGSLQPSVRRFPTPWTLFLLLTRFGYLPVFTKSLAAYEMRDFPYDAPARVNQVMGAAFAIRRAVANQIGLLDPRYWIWFEEVDYCRRAVNAGWEVWFTPAAAVVHARGTSFRQVMPAKRAWWFGRSALQYARVHFGWLAALLIALTLPIALLTAGTAHVLQWSPSLRASRRA